MNIETEHNVAQTVGRLMQQRDLLTEALKATLAWHAVMREHRDYCSGCGIARTALADVQRLKEQHG